METSQLCFSLLSTARNSEKQSYDVTIQVHGCHEFIVQIQYSTIYPFVMSSKLAIFGGNKKRPSNPNPFPRRRTSTYCVVFVLAVVFPGIF